MWLLVILGVYMGWVEAVYGVVEGSSMAEHQAGPLAPSGDAGSTPAPVPTHDWYAPLPKPPEMFKKLPVLQPDDTPMIADRYVRSRH